LTPSQLPRYQPTIINIVYGIILIHLCSSNFILSFNQQFMKKVYVLLTALVMSLAIMVQANPLEKANIKTETAPAGVTAGYGTQQVHRPIHHRRHHPIHHRRHRPHTTVIVHH
jgi:hypothetical protein